MIAISLQPDDLSARLFRTLSRWSLVTALMIFATTALYLGGVGSTAADSALGPEYAELMRAVRSPVFFRLATVSEVFYWLMIGGTLIIYAGLFARRAPIRGAAMAACGIAQLTGSLGSFLRLNGISDLAARYATAAPIQQTALLQSFLDLKSVIQAHEGVSILLEGAAFLLVAWVTWRLKGFPRWLAAWLAILGLFGLAIFILRAAGTPSALQFPIILLELIIGPLGLHVAMALTFWRPSTTLVSGVVGVSAA